MLPPRVRPWTQSRLSQIIPLVALALVASSARATDDAVDVARLRVDLDTTELRGTSAAGADAAWEVGIGVPVSASARLQPTSGGAVEHLTLDSPTIRGARGSIRLSLALRTALAVTTPGDQRSVGFLTEGERVVLRYALLGAFTASGKQLAARLELAHDAAGRAAELQLQIDGASPETFPLTVELLAAEPKVVEWLLAPSPEPPVVAGAASSTAQAAAPLNDICDAAEVIPGAGPFPYLTTVVPDVREATETGDPTRPRCASSVSRSVWYTFTPEITALYTLSACADAPTATTVDDTVLAIYTSSGGSCAGPFGQISSGCDDDGCTVETLQSTITNVELTAGTTYYVLLWVYGTDPLPQGNTAVQLRVSRITPPANETCAGAIPLALAQAATGTNLGAHNDYQLADAGATCLTGDGNVPTSAVGRDSVWSFIAPVAGQYSFRAQNLVNGGDLVVYATSECPPAPPTQTVADCLGGANRNTNIGAFSAVEEAACISLGEGEQAFVFVDEAFDSTGRDGAYRVEATTCTLEDEPNDTPAEAVPVTCGQRGAISPAGDIDFYALGTQPEGSRVFAMADGSAAGSDDFDIRVTTATDTLEYDDDNNDTPFGNRSPNVAGTEIDGAPSFLRVTHFSEQMASEPYRLYVAIQPDVLAASAESEPNDTLPEANESTNNYLYGTVASGTDVDLFRFTAAAGDLIFLGLDLNPLRTGSTFNGRLALLDAAGNVIVATDDRSTGSSNASGAGALDAPTPYSPAESLAAQASAAGTYYARVTGAPSGGDYVLSISLTCGTAGPAEADLAISKQASTDPAVTGEPLTYTVEVTNRGPDGVVFPHVRDDLPAGVRFVSLLAPASWTCATPSVGGTGSITCVAPSLAAGETEILTIDVTVDYCLGDGSLLVNTASVTSAATETNPGDETDTSSTTVSDAGNCDDGNTCTVDDTCVPGGGCQGTPVGAPAEVQGLIVEADLQTLNWDPVGGPGVVYDVVRGTVAGLPVGSGAPEFCLWSRIGPTMAVDSTMPASGECLWYIVRAQGSCGLGTYGFTEIRGIPVVERVTEICP